MLNFKYELHSIKRNIITTTTSSVFILKSASRLKQHLIKKRGKNKDIARQILLMSCKEPQKPLYLRIYA